MKPSKIKLLWLAVFFLIAASPLQVFAEAPNLKTPEPVIYLADNLDEKDNLGWCIDTVGRGLADKLHAHSCKPFGGDVQFYYNKSTRQIASATFTNLCADITKSGKGYHFGLVKCSATSKGQMFDYDGQTSEFHPSSDPSLCLGVGAASRSAGPFMSRGLTMAPCKSLDAKLRQWVIKGTKK